MELILENLPATLAGGVAALCLTAAPAMRSRSGILALQLAAGIAFSTHYALLGVWAPSLVNVLGCVQTGAALFACQNRALNRIGWALIPFMLLVGFVFWTGPVSATCVAAMALIAVGRMQQNQAALRSLILAGGVFWTIHDYAIDAWIALAADLGALIIGAAAFAALYLRIRIEWRTRPSLTQAVGSPALT